MSQKVAIPLIQSVNKGIPAIKMAPSNYPENLETDIMPVAICFPGEGSHQGNKALMITERSYYIDVYVDPITQGIMDDPIQEAMKLCDLVVTTWNDLKNDAEDYVLDYGEQSGYRVELNRNENITDTGWRMDLQWEQGVYYFGFRVTLPMMVRWGTGLL